MPPRSRYHTAADRNQDDYRYIFAGTALWLRIHHKWPLMVLLRHETVQHRPSWLALRRQVDALCHQVCKHVCFASAASELVEQVFAHPLRRLQASRTAIHRYPLPFKAVAQVNAAMPPHIYAPASLYAIDLETIDTCQSTLPPLGQLSNRAPGQEQHITTQTQENRWKP